MVICGPNVPANWSGLSNSVHASTISGIEVRCGGGDRRGFGYGSSSVPSASYTPVGGLSTVGSLKVTEWIRFDQFLTPMVLRSGYCPAPSVSHPSAGLADRRVTVGSQPKLGLALGPRLMPIACVFRSKSIVERSGTSSSTTLTVPWYPFFSQRATVITMTGSSGYTPGVCVIASPASATANLYNNGDNQGQRGVTRVACRAGRTFIPSRSLV